MEALPPEEGVVVLLPEVDVGVLEEGGEGSEEEVSVLMYVYIYNAKCLDFAIVACRILTSLEVLTTVRLSVLYSLISSCQHVN